MAKPQGFRREMPLYALKFEGDEFDGLQIMAKSIPLYQLLELQELQSKAATDPEAPERLVRKIVRVIQSWNLEDDDGQPVPVAYAACKDGGKPGKPGQPCSAHQADGAAPCEYTGLGMYDLPFVMQIFVAWQEAIASIPNLSKGNSNAGGTSPEPSIPMEPLSPSPAS